MHFVQGISLLAGLVLATPALAYIDPGSGSLLLQILIAAFVGALFKIRLIIASIKSWFRKSR